MQTLFTGVYLLEGVIGGRPLQLVYIKGDNGSVLLDTGCAGDPEKFVVPQIMEAGGHPSELTWIINTHSDLDHTGGNFEMKQMAPRALLACGDEDREACGNPEYLLRFRYDAYRSSDGIYYDHATTQVFQELLGKATPIDVTFTGGERLNVGVNWNLEVIRVPGHSKGHLALLDHKNRALYAGDAIHGAVYLDLEGKPKLCPTYVDVDDYLGTIRLVRNLPISTYVSCHWPVKKEAEIQAFCQESEGFVDRVDRMLHSLLVNPLTLREICLRLGPELGEWPREVDLELIYALNGHLERLITRGVAERTRQNEGDVWRYQLRGRGSN